MGAIALSAGVRSNLLSLQTTALSLRRTQQNLATGNKVNSALDNPANYFTSTALRNRAGALNALIDQIGQAQQALHQADNGITALTKLVRSALAVARQAAQAPVAATGYSFSALSIGITDVTPQPATTVTGAVDFSSLITNFNGTVIRVGGVPYTVTSATSGVGIDQMILDINGTVGLGPGGAATASKDSSGRLVLTSNSAATITVDYVGGALATGLVNPDLVQVVPGLSGTSLTVQANDTPPKTINFGTAPGEVSTYSDLKQALAGTNVDDYIYPFGGPPRLELFALGQNPPNNTQPSLTISGTALAPLGLSAGTSYGPLSGAANPARAALAQQYNQILQQIDQIAGDASYSGNNLLMGNSLNVRFNESGSSTFSIGGAVDTAAGLSLTPISSDGFQTDIDVGARIGALLTALGTLQSQAAKLGGHLSTVLIRQDFTSQMIAALKGGADSLVLADANEEGADLLALQTRESLSTTALSLSAQSDRNALKLFG
jgi:flagellin